MSDSDRPTFRPRLKQLASLGEIFKAVSAIALGAGAIWGLIYSGITRITTDEELLAHNLAGHSHPALRDELEKVRHLLDTIVKQQEDIRYGVYTSLKWHIRLRAADRESDPRLKMQAADFYEEEFEVRVRRGETLENAFLEALRTSWRDRPHVR